MVMAVVLGVNAEGTCLEAHIDVFGHHDDGIFAVLCLTVFALLGLSTVQADTRLSDASADAIAAYYAADREAEAILARLRNGEAVDGVETDGSWYSYSCPVNETQSLFVTVELTDDGYTVWQWQTLPTIQWESDDSLVVWDGEMIP